MRSRLLFLLVLGLFISKANAQYVNIPDAGFRNYLIQHFPSCSNNSMQLDTTCSQVLTLTDITEDFADPSIKSLDGVQYFKSIWRLRWKGSGTTGLNSIPKLPQSLRQVDLSDNNLTNLPPLPDSLTELFISNNKITSLSASNTTLSELDVEGNPITNFPLFPASLSSLNISHCGLNSLPALPNALKILKAEYNNIVSLPTLPSTLGGLHISGNNITTLPNLPPSLEVFVLKSVPVTTLPTLPSTLKALIISGTKITSLNTLPPKLITFEADSTLFTSLPALPATISTLSLINTKLSSLPQLPDTLEYFHVSNNNYLASLPALPINLRQLFCSNIPLLQSLPTLPIRLELIDCRNNQGITTLPTLPYSIKDANFAHCSITGLTVLPTSGISHLTLTGNPIGSGLANYIFPQIQILDLDSCHLTSLRSFPLMPADISLAGNPGLNCLPLLPNFLSLDIRGTGIKCLPNLTANGSGGIRHDNSPLDLPLCNLTNNVAGCVAFPAVKGVVFFDMNSNGIKDTSESGKANCSVFLSNGLHGFSNDAGYYEINTDTVGSGTVRTSGQTFFNAVPNSVVVNLSTTDVIQNFALQPLVSKDSVSVSITPFWAGRPGFSFKYTVRYQNEGSTNLNNAVIKLTFDSSKLTYDSTSDVAVAKTGNQLILNKNLPVGAFGTYAGYFTIKNTTSIGDSLLAHVIITGGNATGSANALSLISGSFDPNDKESTPILMPEQVQSGSYINYTIRFQNTGNDTAFHVVIADTLSDKLQWNSLELVASSHYTKTTVKDDKVYFEMRNIMLPDSNVNASGSHGFVRFRIKPKNNVNVGTDIPNKAAIYFDYNTPVTTNTAITKIRNGVMPLRLLSFKGYRAGEADKLNWSTANEVNTKFFQIEKSADGRRFSNAGYVYAHGRGSGEYNYTIEKPLATSNFYRLRMVDLDGAFTYSNIVLIKGDTKGAFALVANPVKDKLVFTVISLSLANTEARFINSAGVVVKSFVIKGTGNQTINVENLAAGVYYLQTIEGTERVVK